MYPGIADVTYGGEGGTKTKTYVTDNDDSVLRILFVFKKMKISREFLPNIQVILPHFTG